MLPLGEVLARGFLFRERVADEREASQAPTPAIDSLGYIRGFKSYYHTHQWGCHQWRTAPRPRTRSLRVSPFGPGRWVKRFYFLDLCFATERQANQNDSARRFSLVTDIYVRPHEVVSALMWEKEFGFSISIINTYSEVEDSRATLMLHMHRKAPYIRIYIYFIKSESFSLSQICVENLMKLASVHAC